PRRPFDRLEPASATPVRSTPTTGSTTDLFRGCTAPEATRADSRRAPRRERLARRFLTRGPLSRPRRFPPAERPAQREGPQRFRTNQATRREMTTAPSAGLTAQPAAGGENTADLPRQECREPPHAASRSQP